MASRKPLPPAPKPKSWRPPKRELPEPPQPERAVKVIKKEEELVDTVTKSATAVAVQPKLQIRHCRLFNFSHNVCYLERCQFLHVSNSNYDHKAKEYVQEDDPRYITEGLYRHLKLTHDAYLESSAKVKCQPPRQIANLSSNMQKELTLGVMQQWLSAARSEEFDTHCCFLRDIVTLEYDGSEARRFPFEAAEFVDDYGNSHQIRVKTDATVVWTAMLYGRNEGIMKHLSSCLLLGYQLRYKVRPLLLSRYNVKMENVLFLTKSALTEDSFRAVSFVWALKFVDLPDVHESRVKTVSEHLIGDNIEPEHVFLKFEAFKMDADVCIISDLDVIVVNEFTMAKQLAYYAKGGKRAHLLPKGTVGVMQRARSQVIFDSEPEMFYDDRSKKAKQGRPWVPVSYCYALLRTSEELQQTYSQKMKTKSKHTGLLSDQDLLGEVLQDGFLMMHHDFIAFPSWWIHDDIWASRAADIMQQWDQNLHATAFEFGENFVYKFGAIHQSRSFDFITNAASLESKSNQWVWSMLKQKSEDTQHLKIPIDDTTYVPFTDYVSFLEGFWSSLKQTWYLQRQELSDVATRAMGHRVPGMGLSKILVTMGVEEEPVTGIKKQRPKGSAGTSSSSAAPWKR